MRVVEQFERRVEVRERDQWIPLSSGHRLAARIWLPDDASEHPVPALLEYLPYRKRDMTRARDEPMHHYFAGHGYASVRVDLRGSGDSFGTMVDEYTVQEHDDALEVIAWLAAQPWCTGRVGMFGISWGGFNALQMAARRPPALGAIITSCSTDDRYTDDMHYAGGCLLNDNLDWGTFFFCIRALPGDPESMGEGWRDNWLERLAVLDSPVERWMRHPLRDDYWKHGSVDEDYAAIDCPVFAVGGWLDGYSSAIPRLLANLAVPRRGLIGPHAHQFGHSPRAPGPAIGFLREALRWWDRWLKDVDTGIMAEPMLRAFMGDDIPAAPWYEQCPGRWVAEVGWPSPRIEPWRLHLNDPGVLETAPGPPGEVRHCSSQVVGLSGGEWCPYGTGGTGPEFPGDQRADDGASIVFDSAPLEARVEILGQPVVTLELSVDRPVAFVAVRLNDVKPDGPVTRVTYHVRNLCHDDGHENGKALIAGRRMRVRIPLHDVAYSFAPGHRIRVSVSTTYWPMVWPSPRPVTLALATGESHVDLPVRPTGDGPDIAPFESPEEGPAMPATLLEERPSSVTLTRDVMTGRVEIEAVRGGGIARIDEHGLHFGVDTTERLSITEGDPLSARTEMTCVARMGRGDWEVQIRATHRLSADAEAFHLRADVDVTENGDRIFARRFDPRLPRGFL